MRHILSAAALLTVLGSGVAPPHASARTPLPNDQNVLFWSLEVRDAAFRAMEKLPQVQVRDIKRGDHVSPLPSGAPLPLDMDLDKYMVSQRTAGLIVVHKGKVRIEKYGLDYKPDERWTSFSVAKSFASTLVGAAIQDGHIKSVDDKVTTYIPGLKGSAYDEVTVRQLLTMTSGVKWNEDYTDPQSDVARFAQQKPVAGEDVTVTYMKQLPREAPAGEKWVYKTGETNLIGVLVSSATGKPLAEYLSEKIWRPFGMEQDAVWMLGATGHEVSGCCMSATLRDYARFGQFILADGVIAEQRVLPVGWVRDATVKQADIGEYARGYGYQWWTNDDGSFAAQGIFGQGIFIDPARELVIVTNGNWPIPTDGKVLGFQRELFYDTVQEAIEREARGMPPLRK